MVPTVLHRGSCVMCRMFICYCRVACARPAREHESSIFMYLAPFRRVSCLVCGRGGGHAVCDRSVESGVLHGLVVVRVFIVNVCVFA